MKIHLFILLLFIGHQSIAQKENLTAKDLQLIVGTWHGSLTYLDYTSGKPYTMPANVEVKQIGQSNQFLFINSFPKEANANWTDTITIAEDGKMLNEQSVVSKILLQNGNVEIVTQVQGIDGNDKKPALLKYTYLVGKNVFIIRKDVQFAETDLWINRHEYKYELKQ